MQRFCGSLVFRKVPESFRQWQRRTRKLRKAPHERNVHGDPLRRTFPFFQISDLLLDLDAEGAQGVRAFDSELDGVPEADSASTLRELQPMKRRVAEFEKTYKANESNFKSVAANYFNPWHISDFDILVTALLDPRSAANIGVGKLVRVVRDPPISYAKTLKAVLDGNGIPLNVRDSLPETLAYMLRRRWVCRQLQSGPEDGALLREAFEGVQYFSELERIVTRMTKTPHGCRMLAESGNDLHAALIRVTGVVPVQAMSLLNNMLMNLDRYELHISTKIYELGIRVSLACSAFITAQQYLRRWLEHGNTKPDDSFIDSLLTDIFKCCNAPSQITPVVGSSDASNRLSTIFSLLTGYVPGEHELTIALRSLIRRDKPDTFRLYIRCLARLGAFRTIWHEWHTTNVQSPATSTELQYRINRMNQAITYTIYDVLVSNPGLGVLAEMPVFPYTTGQFQGDCQHDMVAIAECAKTLSLPGEMKRDTDKQDGIDRARLYEIMSKGQIQQAFPALQAFLLNRPSVLHHSK